MNDNNSINQKLLMPYKHQEPAKIMLGNDGYKNFKNITVQTKVGFRITNEF